MTRNTKDVRTTGEQSPRGVSAALAADAALTATVNDREPAEAPTTAKKQKTVRRALTRGKEAGRISDSSGPPATGFPQEAMTAIEATAEDAEAREDEYRRVLSPASSLSKSGKAKGRGPNPPAQPKSPGAVKPETRSAMILRLLRTKRGASIGELMEVTGWQAHSVRGFLSGTVRKTLGLALESKIGAAGERRYQLPKA
ncbi:MAG: DUF3489 domain-containing protein [Rhizobiaceae bacterium]